MSKPTSNVAVLDYVDYDKKIKYELKHPSTGNGTGVVFDLICQGSSEIKDITRKQFAQAAPNQKISDEARILKAEQLTEERIAACIVGIHVPDGMQLISGIDGSPKPTMENKLTIVRVGWVFEQINKQVNDTQNFTRP